jgi:hypothetical protein
MKISKYGRLLPIVICVMILFVTVALTPIEAHAATINQYKTYSAGLTLLDKKGNRHRQFHSSIEIKSTYTTGSNKLTSVTVTPRNIVMEEGIVAHISRVVYNKTFMSSDKKLCKVRVAMGETTVLSGSTWVMYHVYDVWVKPNGVFTVKKVDRLTPIAYNFYTWS